MNCTLKPAMPLRPTGYRLLLALGAAVIVVALTGELLARLASFADPVSQLETLLTVRIKAKPEHAELAAPRDPQPATKRNIPPAAEHTPAETPRTQPAAPAEAGTIVGVRVDPAPDWQQQAKTVAIDQVEATYRQNTARAEMWRKTPSVMFRPEDVPTPPARQPLLANFYFKPEVHVFGLGLTIGSCFFGIPLVGIPVEERTVGPTVIYCASRSKPERR